MPVTVWDRAVFPRDKACGEYLSPGAVGILRAAGALEGLPGARISGVQVFPHKGEPFDGCFASGDGGGLSVRRIALDARLLEMARRAGADVRESTAYASHTWESGGATVQGRGPDGPFAARFKAVVGADGGHSAVARHLGVVRPIARHQKVAFVGHVRGIAGMADRIELHAGPRCTVGLGPGSDGATNVTAVVRQTEARQVADDPAAVLRRFPGLAGRFEAAEWEPDGLTTGTFGHSVTTPVADGVLLVGDSAGFIDPFTGEGVYFALRGAELAADALSAALASGPASARALAVYQRAHRAAFGGRYALCDIIQRVVAAPAALSFFAARLRRHPDLADMLIRTTGDILPPRRILSLAFGARLLA